MAKKGLTREVVIGAAQAHIERKGLAAFSLRDLATHLGVRVSSLYNHVGGQSELLALVGVRAAGMLAQAEAQAIEGKRRDEALFALAQAYRAFAWAHPELYRIIMGAHTLSSPALVTAGGRAVEPIERVVLDYGLGGEMATHALRLIRSSMHGFFAHENAGGFKFMPTDRNESYRVLMGSVADWLNARERTPAEATP